jgi:hypothetical protein
MEANEEDPGSEPFKAPMCTLFNISPGPPVGTPLSVHAPLEPIKRRARMLEHKFHELTSFLKLTKSQAWTHTHTPHKFHRH